MWLRAAHAAIGPDYERLGAGAVLQLALLAIVSDSDGEAAAAGPARGAAGSAAATAGVDAASTSPVGEEVGFEERKILEAQRFFHNPGPGPVAAAVPEHPASRWQMARPGLRRQQGTCLCQWGVRRRGGAAAGTHIQNACARCGSPVRGTTATCRPICAPGRRGRPGRRRAGRRGRPGAGRHNCAGGRQEARPSRGSGAGCAARPGDCCPSGRTEEKGESVVAASRSTALYGARATACSGQPAGPHGHGTSGDWRVDPQNARTTVSTRDRASTPPC